MIGWLLIGLILILLFGGLGVAVSPLFFILLIILLVLALGGGGYDLANVARAWTIAWALMNGRNHVLPEDIQTIMPCVVNHRLRPAVEHGLQTSADLAAHLLTVPVP